MIWWSCCDTATYWILVSKLGILQNISSIRVLWFLYLLVGCNICGWSDDNVLLSINSLISCAVSKLKRSVLKFPIGNIFCFALYLDLPIGE